MNIETANRLLQYRKKHNLSQEELAAKIGVSRQAISKWERAEASPDTDNLILLAEIYGVSLDELLKGENAAEKKSVGEEQCEKADGVSFKGGIHVDSKDGDSVHLSFKDGIHVYDKHGAKVDIGRNGIFINEDGKQRVYTDSDGNVIADEEALKEHLRGRRRKFWNEFPFFILPIIAFVWWGASGVCFGWRLSWICFLTIPLYYTLADAIYKRKASHFAYPVLVVIGYILFGYFNVCGGWSMGWLAFLTIPVYYWICSLFGDKGEACSSGECE